jgi:ABC-type multidrug transport system fused ATPase/permease subunit
MGLITKFYHFLHHHISHSNRVIGSIVGLSILDQSFSIGCVYVWKSIIDQYLIRADQWSSSDFYIGVLSLVFLWQAMSFISRLAKNRLSYKTTVLADQVSLSFFERAYGHVMSLSHDFHESRSTGQVMRQLSKAREDLDNVIKAFFDKLLIQVISFLIVTGFFFYIRWQIALTMLAFIPVFLYFTYRYTKKIDTVQRKINNKGEKAYASVQQALDAFMVVQSFQSQEVESARLRSNNRLAHQGLKSKTHAFQRLAFVQGSLINLARLSIIAAGGYYVFHGQITVGEVVLLSMWGYFIYNPMYQFSELLAVFAEGMDSVARVEKLMRIEASIKSPRAGFRPIKVRGEVHFENVAFHYSSASTGGIKHIDFTLPPGGKLAIVGPSGSGKSTLAKLLPRFYDVNSGCVRVDGVDVKQWDLQHLRAAIGMVLQDVVLFNDTIFNNIAYACGGQQNLKVPSDSLRKAVEQAAQKAFAHDFIMALPQGYDTVVGERGIKLSGGEKQRIGIARTILRDPPILILDEATSALDSESEVMVMRALEQICENHTTLTIAHRLSTIRHCDQILFCEKGQIVERGDHDSLMALEGRYHRYVLLQREKETLPQNFGRVQSQSDNTPTTPEKIEWPV